jgi:Flp pilus assembly protein TadG
MKIPRKYLVGSAGSITAEMAIAAPILAITGFAACDLSYLMVQTHQMEDALTQAGHYLAQADDPTGAKERAKMIATRGSLNAEDPTILKGWDSVDIIINIEEVDNTAVETGLSYRGGDTIYVVTINSTINYQGLGFLRMVSGKTFTLDAAHEERLFVKAQA